MFDDDAPETVENFRKLAADGFYDGLDFHRIIPRLHDPGRLPAGHRHRRPGLHVRGRVQPRTRSCAARWRWPTPARTRTARSSSSSRPTRRRGSTASTPCSARSPPAWTSSTRSRASRPTGATARASDGDDRDGRLRRPLTAAWTATARPPSPTDTIAVENPATGRGHPRRSRSASRPMSRRAWSRAAARRSPPGRRSASRPRGACCAARRSGCSTTPSGVIETIVSETGKTYEDAQIAEVSYGAAALRLLGQARAALPGRREGPLGHRRRARAQA